MTLASKSSSSKEQPKLSSKAKENLIPSEVKKFSSSGKDKEYVPPTQKEQDEDEQYGDEYDDENYYNEEYGEEE